MFRRKRITKCNIILMVILFIVLNLSWKYHAATKIYDEPHVSEHAHTNVSRYCKPEPLYRVNEEELSFPLAYSILAYSDIDRVQRLLRAIHRPHNQYCIHVDAKSSGEFMEKLRNFTACYGDNVFLVPDDSRINVIRDTISLLDADLLCARLLLHQQKDYWRYWINLTGYEFPLRTNWELVTALRALNGTNLVEAVFMKRDMRRFPMQYGLKFKFIWYKGAFHAVLRREFVEYMLTDTKAVQLYETLRDQRPSQVPDETFFATLNHNPSVFPIPGAFLGEHEGHVTTNIQRYVVWYDSRIECGSKIWRNTVCLLGLKDVPRLKKTPRFFLNKMMPHVEPEAYNLIESWHYEKQAYEVTNTRLHPTFNKTYYATHEFAWNHL